MTVADMGSMLAEALSRGSLRADQRQALADWERLQPERARAWHLSLAPQAAASLEAAIEERFDWLVRLLQGHPQLPLPPAPLEHYLPLFWQLWLPLALRLKGLRESLGRPVVYGVLGVQGTGKTTLTLILQQILTTMGCAMVGFSIDDIYKTFEDRQQLRQHDPRLLWRGPPGTHDIDLGIEILRQVRLGARDIAIPRFDKSLHGGAGDRTTPDRVESVDILLFEGWFLGVRPLETMDWQRAPDPICTAADRQFAQDMNQRLRDYLPLWALIDRLMVLMPDDYRLSQHWRLQAEQQMKASGKTGMADEAVVDFVQYFWKALHPELFIAPLRQAEWVDLVVEVGANRLPQSIYSPGK